MVDTQPKPQKKHWYSLSHTKLILGTLAGLVIAVAVDYLVTPLPRNEEYLAKWGRRVGTIRDIGTMGGVATSFSDGTVGGLELKLSGAAAPTATAIPTPTYAETIYSKCPPCRKFFSEDFQYLLGLGTIPGNTTYSEFVSQRITQKYTLSYLDPQGNPKEHEIVVAGSKRFVDVYIKALPLLERSGEIKGYVARHVDYVIENESEPEKAEGVSTQNSRTKSALVAGRVIDYNHPPDIYNQNLTRLTVHESAWMEEQLNPRSFYNRIKSIRDTIADSYKNTSSLERSLFTPDEMAMLKDYNWAKGEYGEYAWIWIGVNLIELHGSIEMGFSPKVIDWPAYKIRRALWVIDYAGKNGIDLNSIRSVGEIDNVYNTHHPQK